MHKIILTLKYWKSVLITAIILHLSFAPPSEFQGIPTFNNEDKLVHFLMYMGFTAVLLFDSYRIKSTKLSQQTLILLCIVYPVLLGGIIEILQPMFFFPRSASWFDWFADSLGVLAGWYSMPLIYRKLGIDIRLTSKN